MKKTQLGFNVLELVVVLIILVVLGAIAIPKMIKLMADEKVAAIKELTTGLTIASAANYKLRKQNVKKGISITNCTDAAKLLPNPLPKEYKIVSAVVAVNTEVSCTLTNNNHVKAFFVVKGII